jgi:hypothetical protein
MNENGGQVTSSSNGLTSDQLKAITTKSKLLFVNAGP